MYSADNNEKEVQFRIMIFAACLIFVFAALLVRVGYIQIFKSTNYSERSQKTREMFIRIPPIRGRIFSDDGQTLAANKKIFSIIVDPKSLSKKYEERQKALLYVSEITGIDYPDLEKMVQNAGIKGEKFTAAENISFNDFTKILENLENMAGVDAEEPLARYYPHGSVLSHVLGYIGPIDYNEFSKLKNDGYKKQDWIGKIGIENSYEKELRGVEGFLSYGIDAKMNVDKNNIIRKQDPLPGDDLVVSINYEFQKNVEDILADRTGAVVVMRPANGEILAMASYPDFDPNIYILQNEDNYNQKIKIALDTKGTPLVNRVIQSEYPPGSTFKMVSSFVIVEEDVVPLTKTYYCTGEFRLNNQRFGCWSVHGAVDLLGALANSCDIYFYQTSKLFGMEKLTEYASMFGFGKQTDIDIPFEKKGFIPSVESVKEKGEVWYLGNTLISAIGQGDVTATPLQLANYVSIIANGGVGYKPHIVKKILDSETGAVKKEIRPEVTIKVPLSENSFNFVQKAMRYVVTNGTANRAFYRVPFAIAGKTGTAEIGFGAKKQTHSIFVGYGPVDVPIEDQIAVAVVLEFANEESLKYAGNIAAMIFNSWLSKEDFPTTAKRLWYPVKDSYN